MKHIVENQLKQLQQELEQHLVFKETVEKELSNIDTRITQLIGAIRALQETIAMIDQSLQTENPQAPDLLPEKN
jgi:predicted  nucleic acid-binding Zn-ribbon protein